MIENRLLGNEASSLGGLSGTHALGLLRAALSGQDMVQALSIVQETAIRQDPIRTDGRPGIKPFQLAMIVRALVEGVSDPAGGRRALDEESLRLCAELAATAVCSVDSSFGVQVDTDADALVHRLTYLTSHASEDPRIVDRSVEIYQDIAPALQNDTDFPFIQMFEERFGLSLDGFVRLGEAVCGRAGTLSTSEMAGLSEMSEDQVRSAMGLLALNVDRYRDTLALPVEGQPHFEPYHLNPLRRYPILEVKTGRYICPVPHYLLRRVTHGLYYDLVELDRRGFLGLVLRSFVQYLSNRLDVEEVPDDPRSPLTLSGPDGKVFIKCMTRPFGALGRATGNRDHLMADVTRSGGLRDYVSDLISFGEEIDSGAVLVLTALEDFHLANGRYIRGLVRETLPETQRQVFDDRVQMAPVLDLIDLNDNVVEAGIGLPSVLAEKIGDADARYMDFRSYSVYLSWRNG